MKPTIFGFKNEYDYQMFEWVSFIGNYAVHKKTVLHLAEVLMNRVVFNMRSQLYSVLKNEHD